MAVVDTTLIRIWYAFNADDAKDENTYIDQQRPDIGKRMTKYYSDFLFRSDSLIGIWKESHPGARSVPRFLGNGGKNIHRPYPPWADELVGMYFSGRRQNMTLYKGNNSGDDVSRELSSHYSSINFTLSFLPHECGGRFRGQRAEIRCRLELRPRGGTALFRQVRESARRTTVTNGSDNTSTARSYP